MTMAVCSAAPATSSTFIVKTLIYNLVKWRMKLQLDAKRMILYCCLFSCLVHASILICIDCHKLLDWSIYNRLPSSSGDTPFTLVATITQWWPPIERTQTICSCCCLNGSTKTPIPELNVMRWTFSALRSSGTHRFRRDKIIVNQYSKFQCLSLCDRLFFQSLFRTKFNWISQSRHLWSLYSIC